jgi:hypothetical protein
MPFQSEKQRRFMWLKHPEIAKRWAHEYPNQRNLPTYAHDKKKTSENQESAEKKEAHMARNVTTQCNDSRNTAVQYIQSLIHKHANSAAVPVEIPHSEQPVSAGEESVSLKGPDQEGQLLGQLSKEERKPPVNETLHKLAVVLSQVLQQQIADEQAAAQGQEAQQVPQNVNMKQYAQPASATPLPMGMAQAQSQQMQAAMPGAAPQAQAPQAPAAPQKTANVSPMPAGPQAPAAPTPAPVGGKGRLKPIKPITPQSNPQFNPIQAYSGLSASGVIDGNSALGVKKTASAPAWQRSAGKNEEGGLNEKGRKSYEREHGGNLKAPVTEKNPKGKAKKRQNSFCSRMCGMKRVNTGASTAKDPDSRINKSLRKWNCKCSAAMQFGFKAGAAVPQAPANAPAFSPYNAAKDTAVAAGLSTAGTTAGLGAAALLSRRGRMPFLAQLFGNAAKESLLFFNPVRSYRLVKRLPQAARISAEQMRLSNKAFNSPINARNARRAMNNPAKQQAVQADINAARKVQRESSAYFNTHGEAPTETLEKGVGIANGVMNLGVGGAIGLLPHLTGTASAPAQA